MMRGKRNRREKFQKRPLLDELDFKWMISIWTISFLVIHKTELLKDNPTFTYRYIITYFILYIIIMIEQSYEIGYKKKRESLLLFQQKSFVIRLWKLHIILNILSENTQEHSSLNYPYVCVGQEYILSNYPMTFVQAGFCCDAYQKNTTVVVIIIIHRNHI